MRTVIYTHGRKYHLFKFCNTFHSKTVWLSSIVCSFSFDAEESGQLMSVCNFLCTCSSHYAATQIVWKTNHCWCASLPASQRGNFSASPDLKTLWCCELSGDSSGSDPLNQQCVNSFGKCLKVTDIRQYKKVPAGLDCWDKFSKHQLHWSGHLSHLIFWWFKPSWAAEWTLTSSNQSTEDKGLCIITLVPLDILEQ